MLPGVIERTTGPVSYVVKLTDGRTRRCHQDQLRTRTIAASPPANQVDADILEELPVPSAEPESVQEDSPASLPEGGSPSPSASPESVPAPSAVPTIHPVKAYPKRKRVPRTWFEPKW